MNEAHRLEKPRHIRLVYRGFDGEHRAGRFVTFKH